MACPKCGAATLGNDRFCMGCGTPLSAQPAWPTTPQGAAARTASTPAQPERHPWATAIVLSTIGLVVLWSLLAKTPDMPDPAEAAGYRFGRILGVLGMALLVAWLFAGRKSVRKPALFAGLFLGVALFAAGANSFAGLLDSFPNESTDERIARLMREAGGQPIKETSGDYRVLDDILRDYFQDIARINREYQAGIDAADLGELKHLYSADSFRDESAIRTTQEQLATMLRLDSEQEGQMLQATQRMRERAQASALSAADKREFAEGFERGLAHSSELRSKVIMAEREWAEAAQEVYSYALANLSVIRVEGDRIMVDDEGVLAGFNDRLDRAREQRIRFQQAKDAFDKDARGYRQEHGIAEQDAERLQRPQQ